MSNLKGKGLGVTVAYAFEDDTSNMIQEQLARLKFAESRVPLRSQRVLDFGCGSGYNSFYLAQRDSPREVVGIDILPECIEHCRRYYALPNVRYEVQDCLEYNDQLGTFDTIISCEVLEHVSDQARFLANLEKYLAPGGQAFISTPNKAIFSLSKDTSFNNHTHLRELFFPEFQAAIRPWFTDASFYSQVHVGAWHDAYINTQCVMNYIHVLETEAFQNRALAKVLGKLARGLYLPLLWSRRLPDIRKRKHTDFEFVEGHDEKAVWFVAICRKPQ